MNKTTLKPVQSLSCEQLYNLWSSDPDLIRIMDLRTRSAYLIGHIPGSHHLEASELAQELESLGDRLAVLVVEEKQSGDILNLLSHLNNFVFLSQCERWEEMNYPVSGVLSFKHKLSSIKGGHMREDIIFQQLFEPETSTYTYLIADAESKEAAIIDPVLETVDRDLKLIEELGLKLVYALDTHIHADHITGAGEIRKRLGIKTAVSQDADVSCVDIPLEDGQELSLGTKKIRVISTPGHTNTCMTFAFENMLFTGDALLIRTCGRTDFQQGDSAKMFQSVREKLFKFPDSTKVYPGHDYRGHTSSDIGTEKKFNSRLKESIGLEEFKKIMSELKLANPKKIHEAVPANLACGQPKNELVLHPQSVDGIPEVSPEDLYRHLPEARIGKIKIIDVRREEEFNNELSHIEGAELITLGPDLTRFLQSGNRNQEIVFVCRSGGRSGAAVAESHSFGYKHTINMTGGMIRWNDSKLPTAAGKKG